MTPLAGRRILDLSGRCLQAPHALAAGMAAKLCGLYGATVTRPEAVSPFLGAALPGEGPYDAAIGDLAVTGAPVLLRFSVFGPGTGPGTGTGPDFSPGPGPVSGPNPGPDPNPGTGLGLGPVPNLGPDPSPGPGPGPGPGGVNDPPMSELGLLALSGLLGIMGEAGRPPARLAGHQPAYAAGLAGCTALLAALRAATGADTPEIIDISLFDVTCWLNWKVAAAMLVMGEVPTRGGGRSDWFTLPAADGHIALVYMEKDFSGLRDMLGLTDPRFESRAGRLTHRAAFEAAIRPWFAARSRAEITREAQSRRIPIGPVRSPAELLTDPQHVARGFIGPGGMPGMPLRADGMRPHG